VTKIDAQLEEKPLGEKTYATTRVGKKISVMTRTSLERVMNSAEKPHWDADSSDSSLLRPPPVSRISKPLLGKFITASRVQRSEEELRAGTREREAGRVGVRKQVRTEREQVRYPLGTKKSPLIECR
jgi:hypothetical protein